MKVKIFGREVEFRVPLEQIIGYDPPDPNIVEEGGWDELSPTSEGYYNDSDAYVICKDGGSITAEIEVTTNGEEWEHDTVYLHATGDEGKDFERLGAFCIHAVLGSRYQTFLDLYPAECERIGREIIPMLISAWEDAPAALPAPADPPA